MSTNFWELLQQHQGDLTKSGRTVAEYLVQHAAEAQYLSISSLARECQVAEATVFRFCRALGFEGYHEMRIALAQANATGVLVNQQEPAPDADTATLCEHASALFMTAINGTQNALSPQAVDQAVALLHSARQVFCMGQGGSMAAAKEKGLLRSEGKDYVVKDGDMIYFRCCFNFKGSFPPEGSVGIRPSEYCSP